MLYAYFIRVEKRNRQLFAKLSSFLISIGFIQLKSHYSLFSVKTLSTSTLLLLMYVGDIIIIGDYL